MVDFDKIELDEEERELEDSFERGEWRSVMNLDAEVERYPGLRSLPRQKNLQVDSNEEPSSPPAPAPTTHRR